MLQKQNYERQECRFVSFLAGIVGNGSTVPSKSFTLVLVYCKTVSWEMTTVPPKLCRALSQVSPRWGAYPLAFAVKYFQYIYTLITLR